LTSEILLRLFAYRKYFATLILMVQNEVADRLAAQPGKADYGLLSATAQLYARVRKLFTLPPGAFSPPPKVDSAVVELRIASQLENLRVPESAFLSFLKLSFAQKRKTLWNNLKSEYQSQSLRDAMEQVGIEPTSRAEAVPLDKAAALFRTLGSTRAS